MRPFFSVLVMAMPLQVQAHDSPLACPDGTEWRSGYHAKSKTRYEWCVDGNGIKEGPFRATNEAGHIVSDGSRRHGQSRGEHHLYDAEGRLLMPYFYENGKEICSQMSDQALSDLFRELNREVRTEGKHCASASPKAGPCFTTCPCRFRGICCMPTKRNYAAGSHPTRNSARYSRCRLQTSNGCRRATSTSTATLSWPPKFWHKPARARVTDTTSPATASPPSTHPA